MILFTTDGICDSRENMNRDIQLVRSVGMHTHIRFYQWDRPTISLGRAQSESILDSAKINEKSLLVVQRPTGGRHVLHGQDLCISIAIPHGETANWGETISTRQDTISNIITSIFPQVLPPLTSSQTELSAKDILTHSQTSCFGVTAYGEPVQGKKKLAGIAQRIEHTGVLIQIMIPLTPFYRDILLFENSSDELLEAKTRHLETVSISLEEMGVFQPVEQVIDSFISTFKSTF